MNPNLPQPGSKLTQDLEINKPHLLARIKGIVADVDPMWGGFRFPPIFQEPVQNGIPTVAADPDHANPLPEQK